MKMQMQLPQKLSPTVSGRWLWVILLAVAIALLGLLASRLFGMYWLYWGSEAFKRILYEDAGLNDEWASTLAIVLSFFYAIAFVHLLSWSTWKVVKGKAGARQFTLTFLAYLFVFALPHLIHAIAASWQSPDQCFNQRTGQPIKWYAIESGGVVTLFDSPGYDKFGTKKQSATRQICEIFHRQKFGKRPQAITTDPRQVQFFDPRTGAPSVWYTGARDQIRFYDADGFDPETGKRLRPVTAEVVAWARDRAAKLSQRSLLTPPVTAPLGIMSTKQAQPGPIPKAITFEQLNSSHVEKLASQTKTFNFQVCNESPATAVVAVMGREPSNPKNWVLKGWLRVPAGGCRAGGQFLKGNFFVTARSAIQQWGTPGLTFCVGRASFRNIHNLPRPCSPNQFLSNFEKRRIEHNLWTWNLR